MKFSELFNLASTEGIEWFDPILTVDTRLFLDPFLLYAKEEGVFKGAHLEILEFFNRAFHTLAQSSGNEESVYWKRVAANMCFPEVAELCLGYTGDGTSGSGSGREIGRTITAAMWAAIKSGTTSVSHFEEIGIIGEGIGADRISDITATILRHRLVAYTSDICQQLKIETIPTRYVRGVFDMKEDRWQPLESNLPKNPYSNKPILLVPRRYLRSLPTISSDGFWEYCYYNENETIRQEYNQDISRNVDKKQIVEVAKNHPDFRKKYFQKVEGTSPSSYDFSVDKEGLYQWYDATAAYCALHPVQLAINSDNAFESAVSTMLNAFKLYVEQNQGWELLWNDNGSPRKERSSQNLLIGIVKHYCKANDIDISREANIGRGPVDFKVSRGMQHRSLIEIKLAKNGKFWNGLEKQLPEYQKAEEVASGYFLVVVYSDKDAEKLRDIDDRIAKLNAGLKYKIKKIIVDARKPLSASKL